MSLRGFAFRLLRNGETLARHFWSNLETASKGKKCVVDCASAVRVVQAQARRLLLDNVLQRVWLNNSAAADLRRRTAKRLLFGNSAPFLAFVGINLASGTSIVTEEEELEAACWGIRVCHIFCRFLPLFVVAFDSTVN